MIIEATNSPKWPRAGRFANAGAVRRLTGTIIAGLVGFALTSLTPGPAAADPGEGFLSEHLSDDIGGGAASRPPRARAKSAKRIAYELPADMLLNRPFLSYDVKNALTAAIARYKKITAAGGWPKLPAKTRLRPGAIDERVTLLRRRLALEGDLRGSPRGPSYRYDGDVEAAVKHFQMRNGLTPTGVVGRRTIAALNVPAETRLRQLRVNLVRLSGRLNAGLKEPYVLVNIPAFALQAVIGGQPQLRSRVIVGRPDRQTPTLTTKIIELNLLPYWRVPDSIAHRDLVPTIRKNFDYFYKENFRLLTGWGGREVDPNSIDWRSNEVLKYKFRQEPGPRNALGLVRINMPNEHIVYMHDTPLKRLFNGGYRAYSAGCVRVARVKDLAKWLMSVTDEQADPAMFDEFLQRGQSETIKLKTKVPVHFIYLTAWANRKGVVHFRRDIYGRDGLTRKPAYEADEALPVNAISP